MRNYFTNFMIICHSVVIFWVYPAIFINFKKSSNCGNYFSIYYFYFIQLASNFTSFGTV